MPTHPATLLPLIKNVTDPASEAVAVIVFTTPFDAVAPPLMATMSVPVPGFTVKVAVMVSPDENEEVSVGVKVAVMVAVPELPTVAVLPEMLITPEFEDV